MIRSALNRFAHYNNARFGTDAAYSAQFDLVEAGPRFTQLPTHNHFCHGPGWAMTFYLFLDDGDRTDRAGYFSAPTKDSPWINIVASGPTFHLRPIKQIKFQANTLVAWLDGPMSFYGTDAFLPDSINRRQMLRSHVIAREPFLHRALSVGSADFLEICRKHWAGDSEELNAIISRPGNPIDALPRFFLADK